MARLCKLNKDVTMRIRDNIVLGLSYYLAAEAAGVTYQTFKSG
jgi:hypothetical protein